MTVLMNVARDANVRDGAAVCAAIAAGVTDPMTMYSDTVIDHFMSPRNAHTMPDADAEGSVGDPSCGDCLVMYIKVEEGRIVAISYLVFGCCGAIASSSMTSVLAKGKTLEEALLISEEDVVKALDGLPESKLHCSLMGVGALRKAIVNYQEQKNQER